jgi:hypothetical protein
MGANREIEPVEAALFGAARQGVLRLFFPTPTSVSTSGKSYV